MTVRTRTTLKAQIAALIDSAGRPKISAEDLRSVLDDMADSFDFEAMAVGQNLISRVNDQLGDVTWQGGGGGGTGITLAQAIAAVLIDDTAADQFRLTRTDSATSVTIGIELAQAHVLTRYAASSADAAFSEAEWLAGNTSETDIIEFPATAAQHHKGFAIPASESSLTDIRAVSAMGAVSAFNSRGSYEPAVGDPDVLVDIGGESHKTYIKPSLDFGGAARNFRLR